MNLSSQNSVSITLTSDEVKTVLLEYINRMAGGNIDKDMTLNDKGFEFKDVTFEWFRKRSKNM